MYKKVCCKCKVVVLPMFSLPIVLSDLKVPNRNCGTYMCQDNYSSSCKYDWPCNDCTIKRNCIKRSLAWSVNSPFFFATQPVSKKKNSKSTMTQIYSETTVERVLDYRQKLFPSGDWLPIPTRSDRVKLTFANWDYCKQCDHFSCLPFCGK